MKKIASLYFVMFAACMLISCGSHEKSSEAALYGHTWELDYISGPRIAFDGLFPDKKPHITFQKEEQVVEGNNGCNGYRANFTLEGQKITFGDPGPTTMMYCGEGEQVFLRTMKKVSSFRINSEGKLELVMDDIPMMRFKKKE